MDQAKDSTGQLLLWSVDEDPNIRLTPTRCKRCRRKLRVAESIVRKLGPVCKWKHIEKEGSEQRNEAENIL